MLPRVSIIIPIYNAELFLKESLKRILNQTYANKEIIIIDDSSTDSSLSIAMLFAGNNVKVIRQENAGAAIARNTGLAHATGEYIQFLDADDYLSPDKIEKQILALTGSENKISVCNYISFVDDSELDNKIIPESQSGFIYSSNDPVKFLVNLLGGSGYPNFIQTNSWLVPRSVIDKCGQWRNYRCPDDDGEFFARVLLASDGIIYVPGVYNYYRRLKTANKLSANSNKKYIQNTLLTIDLKYNYLKQLTSDAAMRKAFAVQYLNFAVYNYPQHRLLSKIAYSRYKKIGIKAPLPLIGGKIIEMIKKFFGWKITILVKYYLN